MSNPARIGLTSIHGTVGRAIAIGQWLNGDGFSPWEHSFMDLGDGTIIEAEPGGARIRPLSKYANAKVYWCDNIYATLSDGQKTTIATAARHLEGTPYSFLDYDALAMHRLHIWVPGLKDYIADTGHMICSQLVDWAYDIGEAHLFENRWPGYVTPGDLYVLDKRQHLEIDLVTCGACGQLGYCHYCRPRRHYL